MHMPRNQQDQPMTIDQAITRDIDRRILSGARDTFETELIAFTEFRRTFRLTLRQAARIWNQHTVNS